MENHEFEIFVQRCRDKLLYTAKSCINDTEAAEDIVQEAIVKLYAIRHTLDKYRSLDALATTIVRRMAIDYLRHQNRHPAVKLDRDIISSNDEHDERIEEVLRAMYQLPEKQQLILRMKHIEGMECEDIANIIQMNINAVYQNLSRARRAILKQFKTRNL